jgi:hypothetical protein
MIRLRAAAKASDVNTTHPRRNGYRDFNLDDAPPSPQSVASPDVAPDG